ncbi:MAG: hypothetical protein PHP83_02530 [Clostridia bacterium]|nr:hypothetical protein [Clostridia bacterium]
MNLPIELLVVLGLAVLAQAANIDLANNTVILLVLLIALGSYNNNTNCNTCTTCNQRSYL